MSSIPSDPRRRTLAPTAATDPRRRSVPDAPVPVPAEPLRSLIETTAANVAANGPAHEAYLQLNAAEEYAFLRGGTGAAYYRRLRLLTLSMGTSPTASEPPRASLAHLSEPSAVRLLRT